MEKADETRDPLHGGDDDMDIDQEPNADDHHVPPQKMDVCGPEETDNIAPHEAQELHSETEPPRMQLRTRNAAKPVDMNPSSSKTTSRPPKKRRRVSTRSDVSEESVSACESESEDINDKIYLSVWTPMNIAELVSMSHCFLSCAISIFFVSYSKRK